nr:retrotransposon protein, putative, Ty1-copia subclass [Tanacetum cinerariifolium]
TFRVILFSIHSDEWKSFQSQHQTALRISRWRYNLSPAESTFKTPMLDHQDKYMMKAQVHVLKSFVISDVQALPLRKLYCQIYQVVKHMLRGRLLASFQDHEHEGGDTRSHGGIKDNDVKIKIQDHSMQMISQMNSQEQGSRFKKGLRKKSCLSLKNDMPPRDNMGKTLAELHPMLKLHEKGISKKAKTADVLSIREGKIQMDKKKPQRAKAIKEPNIGWTLIIYGHINKKRMDMLQHDGLLQPTHDESHEKCKSCISGNMERKPFLHQVERAKDMLGLIHADVCSLFRTVSRE